MRYSRTLMVIANLGLLINLLGMGYAIVMSEPWHAALHAVLGLAFAMWAGRLRAGRQVALPQGSERFEALEDEVSHLQAQLNDAQDRLDFAERIIAKDVETRRGPPEP